MRHPRVTVTDLEASLGTRYTAETLAALQRRYPGVRFVWLMGADNLASFHRWDRWTEIMDRVPVGVLARPGDQIRAGLSMTARRYGRWRLPPHAARALPVAATPAWALLTGRMLDLSSTTLRARGAWPR
jgi:nicotinate-nucleotide adenylyltransferase